MSRPRREGLALTDRRLSLTSTIGSLPTTFTVQGVDLAHDNLGPLSSVRGHAGPGGGRKGSRHDLPHGGQYCEHLDVGEEIKAVLPTAIVTSSSLASEINGSLGGAAKLAGDLGA